MSENHVTSGETPSANSSRDIIACSYWIEDSIVKFYLAGFPNQSDVEFHCNRKSCSFIAMVSILMRGIYEISTFS